MNDQSENQTNRTQPGLPAVELAPPDSLGDVDLPGEVSGGGTYEELLPYTQEVTAFGITLRVVTLECLIPLRRAAGRPKDLQVIAELQALLEERGPGEPTS